MRSPPMWRNPKLPDLATLRKLPLAAPPAEAAITSDRPLGESVRSPPAAPAIICDLIRSFASGSTFTTLPPPTVVSGTVTGIRHLEIKRGRVRAASGPGIVSFANKVCRNLDLQPGATILATGTGFENCRHGT